MSTLVSVLKMIVVLVIAMSIGNQFLAEVKKARAAGQPWYKPYFTISGLLILIILMVPIIIWIIRH